MFKVQSKFKKLENVLSTGCCIFEIVSETF